MQMAVVLVMGSAMASAKVFKNFLGKIAGLCHSPRAGIMVTCFVSSICTWFNWGFGLIVGALLAKEMARRIKGVDYRLLIASGYSGFVIWHAGFSGSIPLQIAAAGTLEGVSGGLFVDPVPIAETIFHPANLAMVLVCILGLPFLCWAMMPDAEHTIVVDPALLIDPPEKVYTVNTPAEKMEHSKILWIITVVGGFAYLIYHFASNFAAGKGLVLDLNVVNFLFLFLGVLLHGDLRKYVDAIADAASGAAGIILQFPFYAGIMGMMTGANAAGVSLASVISDFFVSISTPITFPMLTFLSAGIVNFFVPSGGGQWAVQGPIVMPAAHALGVDAGIAGMAIAWGDQWTNMVQPFWALPALGVAGLSAKDIMGYCVITLIAVGVVACIGFLGWAMLF